MPSSAPLRRADVAVIGAGVIGLTTAWRLAVSLGGGRAGGAGDGGADRGRPDGGGTARVVLVDPEPGRGASWAAAGMLAPVSEAHYGEERLIELNLRAAAAWPRFAAELESLSGRRVGYRRDGTLVVAADAGDRAVLEELLAFQRELGLPTQWCPPSRCRELEPGLAPGLRGGILATQDHQVDNRLLVEALLAACRVAGVEVLERPVDELLVAGGSVRGLRLGEDELPADIVVLAAGYRSGALAGLPAGALPPVRPVKGQILRLRVRRRGPGASGLAPLGMTVRGVVSAASVYLVPRSPATAGGTEAAAAVSGVVVGATVEEAGEDLSVTVEAVHRLLSDARAVLPGIAELELAESIARLRPGSPDNAPLIGPAGPEPLSGLVVATGHYRNGILLAPATADAVLGLLEHGSLPPWAAAFAPSRLGLAAR
ncbi:MAG TPA: glycine oxidase ThiO [Acidimicrobiales bacterium]|nr:glycine oxidase ThiO [Acidimicrobiales bacterium]